VATCLHNIQQFKLKYISDNIIIY